ncbi:MAG: DUF1549 and DUF1553 domain-containing protein [Gemmataceae bacterium]|nr:DUF1549 and DUF1553 domain-containing protein [Gemmataceae bacterium]
MRRFACLVLAPIALIVASLPAFAAPPTDPAAKAKVIGQPASLQAHPEKIVLNGPHSMQQLVVTGKYADGSVRDLTYFADIASTAPNIAMLDAERNIVSKANGSTNLTIKAGGQTISVPIVVADMEKTTPVSFRNEVIASLNVGSCNSGACHGTPSGKNGFKLSLRGFDPAPDYLQLTRDVLGRRTDRLGAEGGLLMQKALGRVPHDGGSRFPANSVPAVTLSRWFAEGLQDDVVATLPTIKKVDVAPGARVLREGSKWQQLSVTAHLSDGTSRDVTRLTVFTTSDAGVANVDPNGLVEFSQSGEVAILCRYLEELVPVRLSYLESKPGFSWPNIAENNYVDKFVFAKLKELSIQPSDLCTDQEFIRRAFMDVCGILPTAAESAAFLESKEPTKRAKLIDELLERPEYSDLWTLKWSDVLRSNRKTIQVKGTYVFQKYLHSHISRNTPVDQMVREIITASGSTYSSPAANYYRIARDPTSLAETTAQLFFGIRMQCAKCHNHPFERWTQDDYYSMSAWFARVKQKVDPMQPGAKDKKDGAEMIFVSRDGEVTQPRTGKVMAPKFLGGAVANVGPAQDRREVLASWMTSADNAFFAKSIVNRMWFHVMGKGIVDPVDDFRDSNPSANDALLDAMAKDFVANKFDAKHLLRMILNSRTYQLSAQTNDFNKDDTKYFSHAVTKLHTAETLLDAICAVTDVPEKYAGMPAGTRAVQLPDGEANHPFLKTFGQPARELACECEREGDSNLAQALQLINGPTVNDRLRNPANRIGKLLEKKIADEQVLKELFLVTLSRQPSADETRSMLDHVNKAMDKRKAWEDVHWALINSKEFLFRH